MVAGSNFLLSSFQPAYLEMDSDVLHARAEAAVEALSSCAVCPRACSVDRRNNEQGFCQIGRHARVASAQPHFGEEDCLRGKRGSGTIFFASCNLRCAFCQNWDISQQECGAPYPPSMLAELMMELQRAGCHNINFVTPGHVAPQLLEALAEALPMGLTLPIVYNTNGYDSVETLRLLDGIVDIYMPDFKFWDSRTSKLLCQARDYPERARDALEEMHRQVGALKMDEKGIACRGVLVRHLVMPGQTDESIAILQWLSKTLSRDTFVNIMEQYHPDNRVCREAQFNAINRRPSPREMADVYAAAKEAGLWRFA